MPIVAFQNYRTETLRVEIEPIGQLLELPQRSTAGIRYTVNAGDEDRSTTVMTDGAIEFWCNAQSVEVDIVHPSAFENLLWELCVELGFCGGLVDGVPTHVCDLLPEDGSISAETFAALAIQAEGTWPDPEAARLRWGKTIEEKFVEHLGAAVVPVGRLKETGRRPFDRPASD